MLMNAPQRNLLTQLSPRSLPESFEYRSDFISPAEEDSPLYRLSILPFKDFEYQGFQAKRRVVSFGWRYDFNVRWQHGIIRSTVCAIQ
jgi:hypothetical protein